MSTPFQKGLIRRSDQSAYNTLSAAVALPVAEGSTHLVLQAHTQPIWFTNDGTTPTAAAPAWYLAAGDGDIVPIPEGLDAVRIIEGAASATISYMWATDKGV